MALQVGPDTSPSPDDLPRSGEDDRLGEILDAHRAGDPPPTDHLAAFRPAILGIRGGTTAVSVALSSTAFAEADWWIVGWCAVIVAYNVFRIVRPLRYYDDTRSLVRVVLEVAIHVLAVVATGYWASPFVFSLLTAIIVAGFARGFGFAVRIGGVSALAVAIPDMTRPGYGVDDFRVSVQWSIELLLVALVAGYARRVTQAADRQHSLALDRIGRLADANALLFSLHRVAQTLPASLDLDEVLDSTMSRLRDLFRYSVAALLLYDDTDGDWRVARWEGRRLPSRIAGSDLPRPVRQAIELRSVVEAGIGPNGYDGLVDNMGAGLYGVLLARSSVVGVVAIEHEDAERFTARDSELLAGFAEPAALAIDNAQWFARLRTVGADEERTRIARDLHDRIGQSLAYLGFELDRIVKAESRGQDVGDSLERLRNDVRGVIGEVRDTLYDLRTDVSDTNDVPTTLRAFLDRVRERSGLRIDLTVNGTARLPLLQERELWRIAQEAVTNAVRHADADTISVRWHADGSSATLEIVDDGKGFPVGRAGRLDSYGLLGMRERAASIGAGLTIDSAPAQGTTVRCVVRDVVASDDGLRKDATP